MNAKSKSIFVAVLCLSFVSFAACSRKVSASSKHISASSDAKGNRPGKATVSGPAEVTCVSATDEAGGSPPPMCVITGPGTQAMVDIGHKVAISAAGNVVLTCKGKGALTCTADIVD